MNETVFQEGDKENDMTNGTDVTNNEESDAKEIPSYTDEEIANMLGASLDNASFREDYIRIVKSVDESGTVVIPPYMTAQPYGTAFRTEGIDGIFDASSQNGLDFSKIKKIVLPEGLKEIGDSAFASSNIESIILPESLECIGEDAFSLCDELGAIVIPSKAKEIKDGTFSGCGKLDK